MPEWCIGEIRMFGGNAAPAGWLMCDGSALSINDYPELFVLIGNTYGGDGVETFYLPDLRGKLPVGQGTGPGLSRRIMGQQFGVTDVTLTVAQTPAHAHTINASNNTADTVAPGPTLTLGAISQDQDSQAAASLFYDNGQAVSSQMKALSSQAFGSIGSGQSHTNKMRTLSINYIIAVSGTFPS